MEIIYFLLELVPSKESICKILTHFPIIVGFSVEDNLQLTTMYFYSLGVDVSILL